MTFDEAFASEQSSLKFELLIATYSGIARQHKWVADFANWGLAAAGAYSTALLANLDKFRSYLKPDWFWPVIGFVATSVIIGILIRLFLAWSDSALQVQAEMETKLKERLKHLDNQQMSFANVKQIAKQIFQISTEVAKIAAENQPWPYCWFSQRMLAKIESELEVGVKLCFQYYWCSVTALIFQIAFLALAIFAPMIST
jgi:hypothetical protein